MNEWHLLGIEPTNDIKIIKKAYGANLKKYHPEDDPQGFQQLREAYEKTLQQAKNGPIIQQRSEPTRAAIKDDELIKDHEPIDDFPYNEPKKDNAETRGKLPLDMDNVSANIVHEFMNKVAEIYNKDLWRGDVAHWKELLDDDEFWGIDVKEELSYQLLNFLMKNPTLSREIWGVLNDHFHWDEQTEELYHYFPKAFIHFVVDGIHPYEINCEKKYEKNCQGAAAVLAGITVFLITYPQYPSNLVVFVAGLVASGALLVFGNLCFRAKPSSTIIYNDGIMIGGKKILYEEVTGFRVSNPTAVFRMISIYRKDRCFFGKTIELKYCNEPMEMLSRYIENLDGQDYEEHFEESTFDEQTFSRRLKKVGKIEVILGFVSYVSAFCLFIWPDPELLLVGVNAALFLVNIVMIFIFQDIVTFGSKDYYHRVNFIYGTLSIVAALLLAIPNYQPLFFWIVGFKVISIAVICILPLLFIFQKWITYEKKQRTSLFFVMVLCAFFGAAMFVHVNCLLGNPPTSSYQARVVDMKVKPKSKARLESYHVKVVPRVGQNGDEMDVAVEEEVYKKLKKGDHVDIRVKEGPLGLQWIGPASNVRVNYIAGIK